MRSSETKAEQKTEMEAAYGKYTFRKTVVILIFVVATFIMAGVSLSYNGLDGVGIIESYDYLFKHIMGATYDRITDNTNWVNDWNIWNQYAPRMCIAIITGAGLATCGVAMQALLKNPLADPYTVGISDGACFGAVAAIVIGASLSSLTGSMGIVTNAFLCGMVPAVIVILLTRIVHMTPATTILVGVAMSYVFSGLETTIMVATDPDTLKQAYLWQIGSFGSFSWTKCQLPFILTAIGCAILIISSRNLNLLALGDDSASSLGLDVDTFRTIIMIVVSIMVAGLVAFVGIIGFVGLVAPHMVRMVMGGDNRYLLPASMAAGAFFMLFADLVSRIVVPGNELRVGLIASIIGAPIFLYMIVKRRKGYGEGF